MKVLEQLLEMKGMVVEEDVGEGLGTVEAKAL